MIRKRICKINSPQTGAVAFNTLLIVSCCALTWTEKLSSSAFPRQRGQRQKLTSLCSLSAPITRQPFPYGNLQFSGCFSHPQALIYRGISFKRQLQYQLSSLQVLKHPFWVKGEEFNLHFSLGSPSSFKELSLWFGNNKAEFL